jgi:hypothetical protein
LSGDGRLVAFQSSATDLVGDDTDHVDDVFARAALVPSMTKIVPSDAPAGAPTIARGTSRYFTIKGTYFETGTQAFVLGNGLSYGATSVLGETQLSIQVTAAANADIGTATVIVVLPGTGAGQTFGAAAMCTCLDVTG